MGTSRWIRFIAAALLVFGIVGSPFPSLYGKEAGVLLQLKRLTFDPLSPPPDLPGLEPNGTGLYLVQFHGPIQTWWKEEVESRGARLYGYIPDFAFLAWIDQADIERVQNAPAVRWVGPYLPQWRTSPELDGLAGKQEIVLHTLPDADMAAAQSQLVGLGAKVRVVNRTWFANYIYAQVDISRLTEIAAWPQLVWVSLYHPPRLYRNDAARGVMNVQPLWSMGINGAGQVVGVADTGLDTGDPNNINADFAGRVDLISDYSMDGAIDDCSGHGTHVSGSILGNGANSGGTYAGLAPQAHLVLASLEFSMWGMLPYDQCLLTGLSGGVTPIFQEAYDNSARIHSNSWGSNAAGAYDAYSVEVDTFAWSHKDFTIVLAAGNAGADADNNGVIDLDSMGSPGTAKDCITVGATENNKPVPAPNPDSGIWSQFGYTAEPIASDAMADEPFGMAAFSSRGPCDDNRIKPDVSAPGTWIASVRSSAARYDGWGNPINSYYMYMGGTSMATPLTSGAATLVRDYYNDIEGVTNPSSALIKGTLINGAFDMTPGQYGSGQYLEIPVRPNNIEGWGRVDVAHSLVPPAPRQWWYDDHTTGIGTGQNVTYNDGPSTPLNVTDASEPVRVTLVWTDYPGVAGANPALVNDLDLEVIAPDGTHYYGNGVQWDRRNNVEGVDIATPDLGVYQVIVHGFNVAQQTQPFALVVSGGFGSGGVTPTPTNTPTSTPTDTPTNTPTPTPTDTPTPTPTDTPGGPTVTPLPTEPTGTATPTYTPPDTPTSTPTYTPGGPTVTPLPTEPTGTATPTYTPGGPTETPVPTVPTNPPTPTYTPGGPTVTPAPTQPTSTPQPTGSPTPPAEVWKAYLPVIYVGTGQAFGSYGNIVVQILEAQGIPVK